MSRKPFEALTGESFEDAYGITQHDWNGRPDIPWMEVQARSRDVANAAIAQDSSFHSEKVAALNATNKKDGEDIQKLLQEIERLKAQVGAEQLDADRVRLASRELQAENERLKELQGVPGVSEKGLMAVGEELIRLKTQLAEAVTLLRGCTSTGCAFVVPEPDTFGTADMCDCRHKAREFLAKAKP